MNKTIILFIDSWRVLNNGRAPVLKIARIKFASVNNGEFLSPPPPPPLARKPRLYGLLIDVLKLLLPFSRRKSRGRGSGYRGPIVKHFAIGRVRGRLARYFASTKIYFLPNCDNSLPSRKGRKQGGGGEVRRKEYQSRRCFNFALFRSWARKFWKSRTFDLFLFVKCFSFLQVVSLWRLFVYSLCHQKVTARFFRVQMKGEFFMLY